MIAKQGEESEPAEILQVDEGQAQVRRHPLRVIKAIQQRPQARVRTRDGLRRLDGDGVGARGRER